MSAIKAQGGNRYHYITAQQAERRREKRKKKRQEINKSKVELSEAKKNTSIENKKQTPKK
jgi:hypothetical protein